MKSAFVWKQKYFSLEVSQELGGEKISRNYQAFNHLRADVARSGDGESVYNRPLLMSNVKAP